MSKLIAHVWVPGHPATKGSLAFKGRGHVEESVKGSEEWRALVTRTVKADIEQRLPGPPTRQPVSVGLTFFLDHPDPCGPTVRAGDIDKLTRNVLDALTDAGAYVDDNQVCRLNILKLPSGGAPGDSGVAIRVLALDDREYTEIQEARNWSERRSS